MNLYKTFCLNIILYLHKATTHQMGKVVKIVSQCTEDDQMLSYDASCFIVI